MKPILPGGRGPAVEDVQRRLLRLGFDLGPTGVDGVFLGRTQEAVEAFQKAEGLAEDGIVGDETWSALVDATFTLGDRSLYLRLPYFHGMDVLNLQKALNTLGFWCGEQDGIFGPYTERAVREFQRSCGQPGDGIVGLETVRFLKSLKHVWEGKEVQAPSAATASKARAAERLAEVPIYIVVVDGRAEDVARRLVNLASASQDDAKVSIVKSEEGAPKDGVCLLLSAEGGSEGATPVVEVGDDPMATASRIATALAVVGEDRRCILLELGRLIGDDEMQQQRSAVLVLDALCMALA